MYVVCIAKDSKMLPIMKEEEAKKDPTIKRILTKKQFFNHHYKKFKNSREVRELAKSLYK